jgi:hypothetical protein
VTIWVAIACGGLTLASTPAGKQIVGPDQGRNPGGVVLAVLASLAILLSSPLRAWRWQSGLLAAKDQLADVADLNARLGALADGSSREDPSRIVSDVAAAISRREPGVQSPARNAEELQRAMAKLESLALNEAAQSLRTTALIEPSEWRVRREASRLLLRAASAADAEGDSNVATKLLDDAASAMQLSPPAQPNAILSATAPEWRWLAIVELERARAGAGTTERASHLNTAADALKVAAALDPYNLEIVLRLMRVYGQLGDAPGASAQAAAWAGKVLELDPLMRLDRTARGLTESEREEAERTARSP